MTKNLVHNVLGTLSRSVAPVRRLVEAVLQYDLRRAFRRIFWVGEWPPRLPDGPVIAYSNHHHFYDGHLAWLLLNARLSRPTTLWMAEWDRFPFFAAVGAQPFPSDDPTRRAATLLRTRRRFRNSPRTVLVYYPEGTLHSPDDGIRPFDSHALDRLGDLYPDATWWPFGVHVTWWEDARPSALLTGGPGHKVDGRERERLQDLLQKLQAIPETPIHPLLEGYESRALRWDFTFASSFFEKYL